METDIIIINKKIGREVRVRTNGASAELQEILTVFDTLLALGDKFVVGANVQDVDQHFRHCVRRTMNVKQ